MFIGGLHPSLTEESLRNYFIQFGKIEKVIIMKDKLTGRSRGFGFIIFKDKKTIDKILSYANCHFLYGKWIECKRAEPKINNDQQNNNFSLTQNDKFNNEQLNYVNNYKNNVFNFKELIPNKNKLLLEYNNNQIDISSNQYFQFNLGNNNNDIINNNKTLFNNNQTINSLDNSNFIFKEQNDNTKFQNYFNKYLKNPSLYTNYFHYKLSDFGNEEVSNLNKYKQNTEKIKLFPEERDDKNSSSNSNSKESNEKEKIENENASSENDKNCENNQIENLFGPDRTNIISRSSKSNDSYKPY